MKSRKSLIEAFRSYERRGTVVRSAEGPGFSSSGTSAREAQDLATTNLALARQLASEGNLPRQ
jgi:hypothetical protein